MIGWSWQTRSQSPDDDIVKISFITKRAFKGFILGGATLATGAIKKLFQLML